MKKLAKRLIAVAAVALFTAPPAFAASFLVDFEAKWDSASFNGVNDNNYYSGGLGADGSIGPNYGVSFVGVFGVSNADAAPGFPFYLNAPSMQGVAYAADTAFMNVIGGVTNALSLSYSSRNTVIGAIKAYSGLNLTGKLLGTFDLVANDAGTGATDSGFYAVWTPTTFTFNGTARSFDLSATASNLVAIDNVSAVPEPETFAMLIAGLGLVGCVARRSKRQEA